jgi:hypothetical protein
MGQLSGLLRRPALVRLLLPKRGMPGRCTLDLVLAVELQEVEGVQHGLGDGATAVQGVEDGDCPPPLPLPRPSGLISGCPPRSPLSEWRGSQSGGLS